MSRSKTSAQSVRMALIIAGVLGASGIVLGAFTAHGLKDWLVDQGWEAVAQRRVQEAETAVRYQLIHAVAILALAGVATHCRPLIFRFAIGLMAIGTVLFSGSLYLLVALNMTWLGAITPIGGLTWIVAWTLVGISGFGNPSDPVMLEQLQRRV